MEKKNIPPFFVGQEVVVVKSFDYLKKYYKWNYPKMGSVVKVLSIVKHPIHNFWLIRIKGCGCELCHLCFAPLISTFTPISFEKVIEQELASVN